MYTTYPAFHSIMSTVSVYFSHLMDEDTKGSDLIPSCTTVEIGNLAYLSMLLGNLTSTIPSIAQHQQL